MPHCFPASARHGLFLSVLAALLLGCQPSPITNEDSVSASHENPQSQVTPPAGKTVVYQVFTRLFGNKNTANKPWGTLEENGVGKFADFTDEALLGIKELGTTHIWYTGVPHHAVINDYSAYGISHDDPDVVKGRAGSPYAVKDYYNVNPDLAVDPANRLAEFEALIARTHAHGMKVIIDIVPNHVARNYESLSSPAGVSDFGAHDNTAVIYARDNNFYYVVGESFQVPAADNGYQPLGGQPHPLADGKFEENPAKWTGNGARAARPDANDWYETVKVNYGIKPDGSEDFPALPTGFEQQSVAAHAAFWLDKDVPDSWRKFRDITHYWLDKGVDGFRYDMAEMVPVAFWSYLNSSIKVRNPDAFLLAEVYQPQLYRDYLQLGKMDYLYDKVAFYDSLKAIMQGQGDTADLVSIQADMQDIERHMLHFLENHDEQRIAAPEFAGDADKGKPAMVVSALISRSPTMLYFGQEVGEDGSENMGFGKPSRTTIFDYAGVPAHQRWMNNGAFDGGQLTEKEQTLRDFYRRVLNISADYPAMKGDYYSLHAASLANDSDYSSAQLAFARWTDTQHMIVAANFNATTPVTVELTVPEDLLIKWQLPQGEVALTEHLNRPQTANKMMVNGGTGRIQLTLPPLGSAVYTIDR
ncbi:alpha-amylase family protein [Alteromonas oceani]|uniref:Alpha-amylase family protein n=1 Tax=Alteromonas oceani TaxID=2071609 RepID=A0ABV7JWU5_9ALTE|nr:alpha-amylase family protein [Alteromonas oceani]